MFGINKKIYYIIASIVGLGGLIGLILEFTKVLPQDKMYLLAGITLMFLAVAIVLKPQSRLLKITNQLKNHYMNLIIEELMRNNKGKEINITEVYAEVDNNILKIGSVEFNNLTLPEAKMIALAIMKDFVMIVYGEMDKNNRKFVRAKIENFMFIIKFADESKEEYKLIDNYLFTK